MRKPRNIWEELLQSGLMTATLASPGHSSIYYQILWALAELARGNGAVSATARQIYKRTSGLTHKSITPSTVDLGIGCLIELGVLRQTRRGARPRYKFARYPTFVEIAQRLNEKTSNEEASLLPPIAG